MPHLQLSSNAKRTFGLIFKSPGLTRTQIMDAIDSTPATTTRILASMEQQGLIIEKADKKGKRGQPSKKLFIRKDRLYSVGINFNHNSIEVALIRFDGSWVDEIVEAIEQPTIEQIEHHAKKLMSKLLALHKVNEDNVIGIGVSVPGDFIEDGKSLYVHPYFPELANLNVEAHLQSFFHKNIHIENDAHCATLCELLVGNGRQSKNFINLYLGYGVSSGLVIDSKPYRGEFGNSGLIGVQFPDFTTIRPSGQNLLEFLQRKGIAVENFQDMDMLYQQQCKPMMEWLACATAQLQEKLYPIARLLDLRRIIVGGRLPLCILEDMTARINSSTFTPHNDLLPRADIVSTELGKKVGVYGAALIPIYRTCFI